MTAIKIKIVEGDRLVIALKEFPKEALDAVMDELVIGGNDIRNFIINSMETTKKAPWFYKRGKKKHFPSMPFNPPAKDKGQLISRIVADARESQLEMEVGVEAGASYAIFLEEGTKNMEKRPFLEPAIDEKSDEIETNIMNAIEGAIGDTFK